MFPYTCTPPTGTTDYDDGVYVYCDEKQPQYDAGGNIIGFLGQCPDDSEIMCEVDSFSNVQKNCLDPIVADINKTSYMEEADSILCTPYSIDVLSGETDIYSANDRCLRKNSVAESRSATTAHIIGSGKLDDDIYVLKHRSDGSHYKVYCNMQHAGAGSNSATFVDTCLAAKGFSSAYRTIDKINCAIGCFTDAENTDPTVQNVGECLVTNCSLVLDLPQKGAYFDCRSNIVANGDAPKNYNGETLLCQRNDGDYHFDELMDIEPNDIVSIQQASEEEMANPTPFVLGRRHYSSTAVTIDGVVAAPESFPSNH